MSAAARVGLILAAAVVLVVAFVLLSPSEEAETPTTQATADRTATTRTTPTATGASPAPQPAATTRGEPEIPTITVRDGRRVSGPDELEFEAGDDIVLRVRSDVAEEIHIHGYDRSVDLRAGATTTVRLPDARLEGAFEVELHGSGARIALLKVAPS